MGNSLFSKQQPEKEVAIETYESLFDVIVNIREIKQEVDKTSRQFISLMARHCNYAGCDSNTAIAFICNFNGLDENIVQPIVDDIYYEYTREFGSKSLMYNLQVRNKFDDEDWQKLPYIPQLVYDNLPIVFQLATNKFASRKRDILLTGLLGVTSGMLKVQGIYKRDTTYPNLFCFIIAPPASGKGVMKYAKSIGLKRQILLRNSVPSIDIFIPANVSTAMMYQHLHNNEGIGILFESEADTMKNTLKNDWGMYDDLLRKAFHFEEATMERKDRSFKIEYPKLSVILLGTPNQIQGIIPSAENGLFSRFIFYTFKSESYWEKDVDTEEFSLDTHFGDLSELFARAISTSERATQFSFTNRQKEIFDSRFEKWYNEYLAYYDEENAGIIYRLANITFRMAMILTAIRFREKPNPIETPLVYCSDVDFEMAFLLAETYKHHSLFLYVTLKNNPVNKKPIDKMMLMFFERLPSEFSKAQAIEVGKQNEIAIAERTVAKYLGKLINAGQLENHKYGFYRKSRIMKTQH